MNSSYLAAEFLELAASPRQKQVVVWTYCERCMDRTDFVPVEVRNQNGEIEVYECSNCKTKKEYKVT
jgi:hypothetical protein